MKRNRKQNDQRKIEVKEQKMLQEFRQSVISKMHPPPSSKVDLMSDVQLSCGGQQILVYVVEEIP